MLEGRHTFGQGNDIAAHRCHQIVNLEINVTTHGTGSQLARPNMGGVMGNYPSVSGRGMNWHLPPWCRILPPTWRGTLTTCKGVAPYPHSVEWVNDNYKKNPELTRTRSTQQPEHEGMLTKREGVRLLDHPQIMNWNRQYCYLFVRKSCIDSIVKIPFIQK